MCERHFIIVYSLVIFTIHSYIRYSHRLTLSCDAPESRSGRDTVEDLTALPSSRVYHTPTSSSQSINYQQSSTQTLNIDRISLFGADTGLLSLLQSYLKNRSAGFTVSLDGWCYFRNRVFPPALPIRQNHLLKNRLQRKVIHTVIYRVSKCLCYGRDCLQQGY